MYNKKHSKKREEKEIYFKNSKQIKIMAKGRQKGFKLHSYTNCIICGGDFTSITYCSKGHCKICYNAAYRKRTTPKPYDRLDYIGKTMSLLSKDECIKWIAKCYDNKFFVE